MKNSTLRTLAVAIITAAALGATAAMAADATTPAGTWKTVDDKTNMPKSLVKIVEQNDTYTGTVEKFLRPDADPKKVCKDCTDERKDKPIIGMKILWDTKKDGDTYTGKILDPENGKTYSAKLTLKDNGARMDVRGYIGVSLIGRTQEWTREP